MQHAPQLDYADRVEWVAAPDGHRLALRVVGGSATAPAPVGVLCLHGIFADGRFFLNTRQQGPARTFLKQGFRLFVGELRGHGRSEWPASRRWDWSFDDYVNQDIPALIHAAAGLHQGPLFVLAHSMGGYALLAALGSKPALQSRLAGVCLLASAVNDYSEMGARKRLLFPFAATLARLRGRFPARLLRLGVADEPPALMAQLAQWAPARKFASRNGAVDYWQCLAKVVLPVWAGVGTADRFHASVPRGRSLLDRLGSRDRTFVELGIRSGFSRDFDHLGVVRGEAAEREVLPLLTAWMQARARPGFEAAGNG